MKEQPGKTALRRYHLAGIDAGTEFSQENGWGSQRRGELGKDTAEMRMRGTVEKYDLFRTPPGDTRR